MTRHVLSPALCLFAAVVGSACTEPPVSVGHIAVALTAPGPGGSIYRLPPALLRLDNAGFHSAFSLDADAPAMTLDVPPGDYAVSAFDLAGDGDVWPLTREDPDGSTTTVQAALDLPPAISVAENQTTGLVIRFHIPSVGPITFSLGSVAVSVEVDGPASSVDFSITAPSMLVAALGFGNGPAVLPSRLPAFRSTGDSYAVTAHVTGPWSMTTPNEACAPVFATASAGGNPGWINLVAEVPAGDRLCVVRGDHRSIIRVEFHRQGSGDTPLLSDLGGPQPFKIDNFGGALLDDGDVEVFDGRVLHLDALLGSRHVGASMTSEFGVVVAALPDGTPLADRWCEIEEFGDGTLTLSAH